MELRYVTTRTFLRGWPSAKSTLVICSLHYGDVVQVTGNVCEQFSEVVYEGKSGWMHTSNLSSVPMRTHGIVKEDVYPNYPANNMLDLANMYLSHLPESFIEKLHELGWSIVITARDLDMYFYKGKYGGVSGVVDYAHRNIYLQDVRQDIDEAIYHEIGHVVDYLSGMVSDSPEFLRIFNLEKEQFHDSTSVGDGHEKSCPREYFASVFSEMIRNPVACRSEIPKSCEFVTKFVKNFV